MPKPAPTTVVSIPLAAHLRDNDSINQRKSLTKLIDDARTMTHSLVWSLIALSGRTPKAVYPPKLIPDKYLDPVRQALAMEEHVPHWLWEYLSGGLKAEIPVANLSVLREIILADGGIIPDDAVQGRKFTVRVEDKSHSFTLLPDGEDWVVARDGRDKYKRETWDKAIKREKIIRPEEISPGDSSPYYLAGWILGEASAPAQLVAGAPAKAEALPNVITAAFPSAVALATQWRKRMDTEPMAEQKIIARLRRSISSCCYEALKIARSWVELDTQAEAERNKRETIFRQALEAVDQPLREQVGDLLDAIAERASAMCDGAPIHPGSLNWKTCEAIRNFMATERLFYVRDDEEITWSHPDWTDFWDEFGGVSLWRPALNALLAMSGTDDALSLGETHRTWYRAQGYAKLTLPDRVRVHVDRSNAGTNGTLASGVDKTQQQRSRGIRGAEPVATIEAEVEWLGVSFPLVFHAGRNRQLAITDENGAWACDLQRNIRNQDHLLGVCKAFDLTVTDSHVRIDIPLQVAVPAFVDVTLTRQLAVGGWYRPRPGSELSSPARIVQPATDATILGVDIGLVPIAGYAVIRRADTKYTEIASGLIGELSDHDSDIFVPGLGLSHIRRLVNHAGLIRNHLRNVMKAVDRGEDLPAASPRLLTAGLGDAATLIKRIATKGNAKNFYVLTQKTMLALIEAVATKAAAAGTKGHSILIGEKRYEGQEQIAEANNIQAERVLSAVLTLLPDASGVEERDLLKLLMAPLTALLLGYQRMRTCKADLGTVSKKHGIDDATMCARRDAIAVRHGYAGEAEFHAILHLGATNKKILQRAAQAACDRALALRNILADLWESAANLGVSLMGIGLPPQMRGSELMPDDPRNHWNNSYGFLRTHAANIREQAHEGLAARLVQLAREHSCTAIAIERLDLLTTSRADRESNSLSRRMSSKDWIGMISRAADIAGIPIVQVDAWWSSAEVAPLQSGEGLAKRCMGIRHRSDLFQIDGTRALAPLRVNAARNIATRSLSGYAQRSRFAVLSDGEIATFARSTEDGKWGVWQDRMAKDLGRSEAATIWWTIAKGGTATLGDGPVPKSTLTKRETLIACGEDNGIPVWLTVKSFSAAEQALVKRLERQAASLAT